LISTFDAGRFAEAAIVYRELLEVLPDNAGLRMNLGLALYSEGKLREAVSQFQAAVRQDGRLEPEWFMLGLEHLKLNETQQAVGDLERALRIDPGDKRARLELADAFLKEVASLSQLAAAYAATGQAELAKQTKRKFERASNSALARTQEPDQKHEIMPP